MSAKFNPSGVAGSFTDVAKPRMERIRPALLALTVLATILYLQIRLGLFSSWNPSTHALENNINLCLSPACIHAASEILYNLSPDHKTLDACTNFEEFVCGGWKLRHELRPDQGDAFTGTFMEEASQLLLKNILENGYPEGSQHSQFSPAHLQGWSKSTDKENFEKMKNAYEACMDEDSIRRKGVVPLQGVLDEILRLWPAGDFHPQSQRSALAKVMEFLARLRISALISLYTAADDKDPDRVVVSISPPYQIGLPAKERYEDPAVVEKYADVLAKVIQALLPSRGYSAETLRSVVDLEVKLAAASPDAPDWQDVTKYYNPMTLSEAALLVANVPLPELVRSLAPSEQDSQRVIVTAPRYLQNLSSIVEETSAVTLQAYFTWKAIQALYSSVEGEAVIPYKRFAKEMQGQDPDSEQDRWRTCVDHVDSGVGWILSRFFVENSFSAKAKALGDRIVSDIKHQFIEKLRHTEWMEESVVKLAVDKVHNIVQKIGYPTQSPNITDPGSLSEYYQPMAIDGENFFKNCLSMRRFDVREEWSALGKPVDRNKWDMTVPTVNAYYNPPGNEIVFPAGIMQFPVFDVDAPEFLSYGAFGSVAGHELSHAFDSTGRHYDQNGNYTDWWTEKTVEAFEDRAACFVDQYSNFTIPGPNDRPLHVNGRLTLGENIADAGGVAASFAAWRSRAAKKPNSDLPGLGMFTQDQLFFVSYGTWWCGKSTQEKAINRIYTDPHAPKWARIIGTMENSRDFRKSFNCPNREPVCELW